ncbi:5'/3'-nucleotidase SurE [Leptothoe kymatousa]|uniref:5'-nucleotidase n=1 Tax=Leptothoe kymatousa TAU-MAC 1615 TaxID=2364775 RepID=A0ABS5XZY9_9CYAN|nr:5'/3'-nucleotidase SurE [Leptothoe kymatousa TAU-MAC 1615]
MPHKVLTNIVLTNDDGIDAPGIEALYQAIASISDDTTIGVVAPDQHLSGCSHQINRGNCAIDVKQQAPQRYALGGTPADCTRVAHHLYPKLNWLLSGINSGGNLGADIYVSGTVAAAREATLLRVPAISFSQYKNQSIPIDWERATHQTARVLKVLMDKPIAAGQFWNVNLPLNSPSQTEPDIVFCPVCTQPLPTESSLEAGQFRYTGTYKNRRRDPGADVDVCFSGNISVSKVCLW